jgi:glycosyltransferase involved in cell wall biosynthesis
MRIGLISTPFVAVPPRAYGGTELVVYELAEGLVDHGHDVTVFATGDSQTRAELRALYAEPQWPPTSLTDLDHVSWAFQQIADGDYDLIHAHSGAAVLLHRLQPNFPLVYTIHHDRTEPLSLCYSHCPETYYVAISHDQLSREVPLRHSTVIHHGLDPSRYAWTAHPGNYLAFIGRMARVKGPHTAIDVAQAAGLPIRVAGEVHPPDREFADAELGRRFALPSVEFVGSVAGMAKQLLLRDARALLAPIEWDEPFGLILIEAMLSGCPVVAFRRGSVPELVEPGVTGFIADSPEEMAELVRPGGPLDRFDRGCCRGRAVTRFSRTRMVEEHERLYRQVLEQQGIAPEVRVA